MNHRPIHRVNTKLAPMSAPLQWRAPSKETRQWRLALPDRFVAFLRTYAALLAGMNRMDWGHFLIMNALGGICWASLFGGGAFLFGAQVKRVTGPASLLLLLAAIGLAAAGIFFFRRHEKELERRAEAAFPGPWLQRDS